MIFAKSAFLVSFLALSNVVVASGPSACLLSAVGQQENPADMKAMCVTNTKRVQKEIADSCGKDKEDALKEYVETCADNDYKVEIASKSSDSASKTGGSHSSDSSASATGGSSSSDESSSGSSTSSSSSASASPSDSVSAGSSDRHVSAAAFAAVVFLGFAATM
ncbi:hypothetical protein BDW42DRAFT_195774 [Aspergillus taichungensis]|uniref:GPI anchored cell wall protein n=1 Tax=Aspergillus taichungensis TaxID=482145 RepID=A0A2J5HN02_9EURO|nr:hypothetical protein BDW42DRAFT_195774 [Aspergillus taichungensis]